MKKTEKKPSTKKKQATKPKLDLAKNLVTIKPEQLAKHTKVVTPHRPLIQIALDTLTIHDAIIASKKVEKYVDVIEVGTILLTSSGKKAIAILKAVFPEKIIVADMKIADAGLIFGKMAFDSGADLVTVICAASNDTIKGVSDLSKKYSHKPEVQIELTCNFDSENLNEWIKAGATHVVYHRSRDAELAGKSWTKQDLERIKHLQNSGLKVSITGGIVSKDIKFFKDVKPHIFIAGRTIRGDDAVKNAEELLREIKTYFTKTK